MNAYYAIFRLRRRLETQYRGAALGGLICQVFFGLVLIALYRALYAGTPQEMPLEHVVTYVWINQAFFRMILSSDPELLDKIRTGGIAYDMCRPVSLYGYYYARIMAQKVMGTLLRAAPMLVFAAVLPDGWGISLPVSLPGFLWAAGALLIGLLCICAMENITMGFTMRTLDSRGMQAMLNLLMMILTGNILPLTLFPDSWQKVITMLPYAQMLDAPIRLYTGAYAPETAWVILLRQAAWTAVLVAAGCLMWRANQRRLVIQGG
jgi:ABC-2 type transport system permease protein